MGNSPVTLNKKPFLKKLMSEKHYLLMLLIPFIFMIIFRVVPIAGNVIAFRRFRGGGPIFGDQWVGLTNFRMFMGDPMFWAAFRNSVILAIINLIVNFTTPIILALLINEVKNKTFRRIVQTISYLPRFLATVIVIGIFRELLSMEFGLVNHVIQLFGGSAIHFMNMPEWYRFIFVYSQNWQFVGFTSIIYLAALTSIDPQLYEAADLDGANRLQRIWHVSLPGIRITVIYMMLLAIGQMLNFGLDRALLLYTPGNSATSDIIETYVFRFGISQNRYSYATAVGMFGGLIGVSLLATANYLSKKFADVGFY